MKEIKARIIELATQMIDEEIDVLEGCRRIVILQRKLKEPLEAFRGCL
jgi:hypothetical protein